jgi:hypothetical protein
MDKCTKETSFIKEENSWSVLEQVARQGAQKMLQLALENEVEEFILKHSNLKDENGKKVVTKNGYMPEREIVTQEWVPCPLSSQELMTEALMDIQAKGLQTTSFQDTCAACPA